jgi:broad specificity phosphatase PhoE
VVVCHGGVIRASLAYLLPDSYGEWWTYSLHTASVTRIQVRPEGSKLVSLNEYEEGVGTLASRLPGTIEPLPSGC